MGLILSEIQRSGSFNLNPTQTRDSSGLIPDQRFSGPSWEVALKADSASERFNSSNALLTQTFVRELVYKEATWRMEVCSVLTHRRNTADTPVAPGRNEAA